ncbi:MAG: hypothetical protein ABFD80_08945 [Acidobacteriota bacterium]
MDNYENGQPAGDIRRPLAHANFCHPKRPEFAFFPVAGKNIP